MLNVEPGSPNSDAYTTVSGVDYYVHNYTIESDWYNLPLKHKEAYIRQATLIIDSFNWTGSPTYADQALQHPRTGLVNKHGIEVPYDEIAPEIVNATNQLTIYLLNDSSCDYKRVEIGNLKFEFKDTYKSLPKSVLDLVKPYSIQTRLYRC